MSTFGCVTVTTLELAPSPGSSFLRRSTRGFLRAKRAETDAKTCLETFSEAVAARRNDIVDTFANVKQTVNKTEREALIQFDACAALNLKAFQIQLDAFAVKMWQAAAALFTTTDTDLDLNLDSDFESDFFNLETATTKTTKFPIADLLPVFNDAGLHIFQRALENENCWEVHRPEFGDDGVVGVVHALSAQCQLLKKMQQFINQAQAAFVYDIIVQTHVMEPAKRSPFPFQTQHVATIEVGGTNEIGEVSGFTVSPDASMFALSDTSKHRIHVVEAKTGAVIQSFGQGCGKDKGLCFSPCSTNLFIAEYESCRIQQVTITGKHVRFVGVQKPAGYVSVDANTQVIVACTKDAHEIDVFDYSTGDHVTQINFIGPQAISGIKLTPDGTAVAALDTHDTLEKSIFIRPLDFNNTHLAKTITVENQGWGRRGEFCITASGDIVVKHTRPYTAYGDNNNKLVVLSPRLPHHVTMTMMLDELSKICCVKNFVFVFTPAFPNKIDVYW